jgi:terminase small subunit-like protein
MLMQAQTEQSLQNVAYSKAAIRRFRVAELVLEGKTEEQIAADIGVHRAHIPRIKNDARTQSRIAYLLEQQKVTADEVSATFASQMRADITDLYDDTGTLHLETIRERGLGHLIKKIKQTRRYEGKGEEREPVDEIEVEVYDSQSAAANLAKVLKMVGPETAVQVNVQTSISVESPDIQAIAERFGKTPEEVAADVAKQL